MSCPGLQTWLGLRVGWGWGSGLGRAVRLLVSGGLGMAWSVEGGSVKCQEDPRKGVAGAGSPAWHL